MTFVRSMLVLIATLVLVGCAFVAPEQQADGADCAFRGQLNARLHVDPSDERWIWATDLGTGAAIGLRIPAGYGVAMDGTILDAADKVIGLNGDLLVSGCHDVIQNAFMIDETDIRPAS